MIIYILIGLNLILGGLCYWKKLKLSGIYLLAIGLADIFKLILRAILTSLSAPVPYTGTALALFNLHNIIYLCVPVILMIIVYRSISKDSGYLPQLIGASACLASYLIYPTIRGLSLILGFNVFYILMNLFSGGIILNHFTKVKGNKDQLILMICGFGGAMSFILNLIFGNWIVMLTCNFLYYLAIVYIILRDDHALFEFLQVSE